MRLPIYKIIIVKQPRKINLSLRSRISTGNRDIIFNWFFSFHHESTVNSCEWNIGNFWVMILICESSQFHTFVSCAYELFFTKVYSLLKGSHCYTIIIPMVNKHNIRYWTLYFSKENSFKRSFYFKSFQNFRLWRYCRNYNETQNIHI